MRVKKLKRMLLRKRNAVVLAAAALAVCVIKNFGLGYAISFDSDNFPNTSFTSNVSNDNPTTINLFDNGLYSAYTDSYKSNFKVIKDFGAADTDVSYPLYTITRSEIYKDGITSKYGFFPTNKETFEVSSELQNPTTISDAGLKYILRYGYGKTNTGHTIFDRSDLVSQYAAVTSSSERQYITQIAIWMYMHRNASKFANSYCKNSRCIFTDGNTAITNNDLVAALNFAVSRDKKLGFVKELLNGAESASNSSNNAAAYEIAASKFSEYTFQNNREYILTGSISLSNVDSNKFISWSATVVDPNHYGIYITDANNNKLSNASGVADNLASNAIIRLHIPLKDDLTQMNLSTSGVSLTFNLVGDSDSVIAKSYRVTSTNGDVLLEDNENQGNKKDKFAEVLVGVVKQTTSSKRYTLSNFTDIRKTDLDSGEEIAGAHLALYDADDIGEDYKPKANAAILKDDNNNNIEWISVANESHKLYLQNGRYGLCETMAPDGYELKTTCEIFEVDNGSAITVHAMTNKLIPIPNTGSFKSYIPYVIGGISIIGGAGLIIILTKRKKKESC